METTIVRTAGGLVVPTSAVAQPERVMLAGDFLKMRRLMAFARTQDMQAVYLCRHCQQLVKLVSQAQAIALTDDDTAPVPPKPTDGTFRLRCACSTWVIR